MSLVNPPPKAIEILEWTIQDDVVIRQPRSPRYPRCRGTVWATISGCQTTHTPCALSRLADVDISNRGNLHADPIFLTSEYTEMMKVERCIHSGYIFKAEDRMCVWKGKRETIDLFAVIIGRRPALSISSGATPATGQTILQCSKIGLLSIQGIFSPTRSRRRQVPGTEGCRARQRFRALQ